MSSLPLQIIDSPTRQHRRLFTELSPGHLELCLDNSSLEKLLNCPRSFELYAVYGRDVGERDALNYGSALHAALECFYLGGDLQDMIKTIIAHFSKSACSENSWRNADHAIESCKRYVQWRSTMDQMTPIKVAELGGKPAVEIPFKLPLFEWETERLTGSTQYPTSLIIANAPEECISDTYAVDQISVKWTGKIDLIRIDKNGRLRPVDHKTTSIAGQTFWSAFELSSQMMGYTWATQQLTGQEIEGVDIDALIGRGPTAKGTGIMHDNEWTSYNYSQDQLAEWHKDICAHIRQLITNLLNGFFPKSTTHCANKYGMCPYHDICKQPNKETSSRILMSGQYAERIWDPLVKH